MLLQGAIIDITVQFSDGSRLPLEYVAPSEYVLEVSTLANNDVIGLEPYDKPYQPNIVAIGQGRGEMIKVYLKLGRQCMRKKSMELTTGYINVDSDFSPGNKVYNDRYASDGHYADNRPSERNDFKGPDSLVKEGFHNYNKNKNSKDKFNKYDNTDKFSAKKSTKKDGGLKKIALNEQNGGLMNMALESPSTKQEPVSQLRDNEEYSPMQIGLYVLLGVFCVGIGVFLVNFFVFMMRYKRKRQLKKAGATETVASANDWVWIGRATLERNAINTRSSRTLMPAEDFNGNHTSTSSGLGSSAPNSADTSNRSSFVSTIKGSECSIRITANPLDRSGIPSSVSENNNLNNSHHAEHEWDYEAMGMTDSQLADYFDNLKESTA